MPPGWHDEAELAGQFLRKDSDNRLRSAENSALTSAARRTYRRGPGFLGRKGGARGRPRAGAAELGPRVPTPAGRLRFRGNRRANLPDLWETQDHTRTRRNHRTFCASHHRFRIMLQSGSNGTAPLELLKASLRCTFARHSILNPPNTELPKRGPALRSYKRCLLPQ